MVQEGRRGLHDSFDVLVPLNTHEICFKYFLNLAGALFKVKSSYKFDTGVLQLVKYPHNEPKYDCDIFGTPGVIFKVRVLKVDTVGPLSMLLGVSNAYCWLSNISTFDKFLDFD